MEEKDVVIHIRQVERRLDRIEKKLKKQVEERKIDLKEKFRLHDRAQNLLQQLEALPDYGAFHNDVDDIVKNLVKLVDIALGVMFPS